VKLKDLTVGDRARVAGYEKGEQQYRQKLLSMGLTRGTELMLVKIAPLGDPVDIEVRGYQLSLRKSEADLLILEKEQ
jgi:ferrous iron transport protein A